jgi:phenylalanyl-tRNA synthetase beta chain
MKISYNWLREYVDVALSAYDLAERLTCAGLAVDMVKPKDDDFVLDFDLTTNRADGFSHVGIAREAAVIAGAPLRPPKIVVAESAAGTVADLTSVAIENPELCHRYTARVIRGITVGPSPAWLVKRLDSVGQRSINNVVDATNFVLLELGHPLHAFDFDRLAGRRIVVRTARAGERLVTLDGAERVLTPSMLVICDAERPVALAGIMGGENTEIGAESVNALLESAWFEPTQVRRTARALNLHSEASRRFERGADYDACRIALDRCAQLIVEVAGGEIVAGAADVAPMTRSPKTATLRYGRIRELTGVDVSAERADDILSRLGCTLIERGAEASRWTAPSHRTDIAIEEDLVEEIIRHIGYEAIPATLPAWGGAGAYLVGEERRRLIRQTLVGQGFAEAICFSWMSEAAAQATGAPAGMALSNPLDQRDAQMRTSLLPGLLAATAHNFNFGTSDVRLFEIGKIFSGPADDFVEEERLGLVATGVAESGDWRGAARGETFHTLKGVVEMIFQALRIEDVRFASPSEAAACGFFPGQAAEIFCDGVAVGRIGRAGVESAERFRLKQPTYVAEIALGGVLERRRRFEPYRPLAKFPATERDISALFDAAASFEAIQEAIANLRLPNLADFQVREVYVGKQIPEGKRALTFSLCYRADKGTLTDEETNAQHDRAIECLKAQFGAQIR